MKIIYTTKFSVCIKYSWVFRFFMFIAYGRVKNCMMMINDGCLNGKKMRWKGKAKAKQEDTWNEDDIWFLMKRESAAYKICTIFLYRQNITKYNSNPQKSLFNRNFRTDVSVKRRKWLFPPSWHLHWTQYNIEHTLHEIVVIWCEYWSHVVGWSSVVMDEVTTSTARKCQTPVYIIVRECPLRRT